MDALARTRTHRPAGPTRPSAPLRRPPGMSHRDPDPLIVTLEADARSQVRFDAARERWSPPERNLVPAHVTLFCLFSVDPGR